MSKWMMIFWLLSLCGSAIYYFGFKKVTIQDIVDKKDMYLKGNVESARTEELMKLLPKPTGKESSINIKDFIKYKNQDSKQK